MSKPSDGSNVFGAIFVGIVVLIAMVPKAVWITLGVAAAIALVTWLVYAIVKGVQEGRVESEKQARAQRAAQAAAAKREAEAQARKEKQRRIDTLGKNNASLVEDALKAVTQVAGSEAARAGWLGDIDFSADIGWITRTFAKTHSLQGVTGKLSALSKPSADDRRILAEAKATIAQLEDAAKQRVALISRCAVEARHIDASLRTEREDARIAEQRAELHGKLSAMLYGIEAAPDTTPTDSAADAVMARVQAYRDIKQQIDKSRALGE
ncbi:hypothetical protein [Mycobacterium sp. C31M]